MPARRPHSQWDYVWISEQAAAKIPVRFPPRLGRGRPLSERVRRWAAATPSRTTALVVLATVVAITLMFAAMTYFDRGTRDWVPVIFMLVFAVPYVANAIFWRGAMDVRCVYAAHLRTKVMRGQRDAAAAQEISDRRRFWTARIGSMGRGVRGRLMMRSVAWRLFMCAYMLFVFNGNILPTLARKGFLPSGVPWSSVQIVLTIAIVPAMFGMSRWTWSRMKARLLRSAAGVECPDCGYEVEQGAAVVAEPGVEVKFGPARCSECGCPWPLVPPEGR